MPDTPLLLCPFCGNKAGMIELRGWFYARCEYCRAGTGVEGTPDEAAAAWNRRAPTQQSDAAEKERP